MHRFCLLRTPSGLEKYVKNALRSQKMIGKERCEVYYYAARDVEQIMIWPVLRTKELTVSPWYCASCDMHNLITWWCGGATSRKDAGSKQDTTASITHLTHSFSCCVWGVFKKECPKTLLLKISLLTAASFLIVSSSTKRVICRYAYYFLRNKLHDLHNQTGRIPLSRNLCGWKAFPAMVICGPLHN